MPRTKQITPAKDINRARKSVAIPVRRADRRNPSFSSTPVTEDQSEHEASTASEHESTPESEVGIRPTRSSGKKEKATEKRPPKKHVAKKIVLTRMKTKRPRSGSPGSDDEGAGRRSEQVDKDKKAKKRNKPGVVALREIRRLQQSTDLLIPRAPFSRLVREIARKSGTDIRFQPEALMALQEAAEFHLTALFEDVNMAAIHGRRVTVMPRDMTLVLKIRGDPKYYNLQSVLYSRVRL